MSDEIEKVVEVSDVANELHWKSGKRTYQPLSINARRNGKRSMIIGRLSPERRARLEAQGYTDIEQA